MIKIIFSVTATGLRLHGSDELWKSLLFFIYKLCFIYDLALSPMLVDALAK